MVQFVQFAAQYNKSYSTLEHHLARFETFHENLNKINEVNEKDLGFKLGINKFSDLTESEFLETYSSKAAHPMLTDRPHKDFEGSPLGRTDGDREHARSLGYDLNNYVWLDSQKKCLSIDWASAGKVGFP